MYLAYMYNIHEQAAPKTPKYLIGSTKAPKAYIEGSFVITQRGFEKTPGILFVCVCNAV